MCHRCKSAVGGPSTPRHARALSLPRPRAPGDKHLLSTPRPPPHHLRDRHCDHHHLTSLSHYRFRWEGGREREIGGCEIHLSRSSAARTWRCRLVQNPRFCGWRLKPGVQAWVPAYAHGPTRGGNGHRPISTQQCKPDCCIAWCLPPWGGRTSAEPELGLGPQHWPSGIPTTVGTPDTPELLNLMSGFSFIIRAGAASQAAARRPMGLKRPMRTLLPQPHDAAVLHSFPSR